MKLPGSKRGVTETVRGQGGHRVGGRAAVGAHRRQRQDRAESGEAGIRGQLLPPHPLN